jgi:hypothetical protein
MKSYWKTHSLQLTVAALLIVAAAVGLVPPEASALPLMALSVNSAGIPLFAGVEDLDDMFMATMEEMDKEISDELSIAHPLWEYLQQNNLIEYKDEINTHVHGFLRMFKNGTVKWFSGYDDSDNTPSKLLGETKTAYGHLTGAQMYNREELVKNSGRQQMIDLVEGKTNDLLEELDREAAETFIGTQDADGRKPLGLGRIMDPTLACCGIDPATAGFEFWKPQLIYKTGTTKFALATEFRPGQRKRDRVVRVSGAGRILGAKLKDKTVPIKNSSGYVEVCGEDVYDMHQQFAETALRLTIADLKSQQSWGSYEMFDYNGKTIVYDPALAAKMTWFMNFRNGVRVRVHRGTNFKFDDWQMITSKVQTKKRNNLLYMAVYAKSRRANAVMEYS